MIKDFSKIQTILQSGGIIGYPTETVYGLGCDPFCESAVQRVFELKQRKPEQAFILLIPNQKWIGALCDNVFPLARYFMETFWPGPLTLVMNAQKEIPFWLKEKDETIALRVSSHPWIQAFLEKYEHPLISTSANLSGGISAQSVQIMKNYFSGALDFTIDGGTLSASLGSTIVKVTETHFQILREGAISKEKLYDAYSAF